MGGKHVHWRYLWLLLQGAVPGLLIGTYLLRRLSGPANMPVVVILLGLLLTASSSVTFLPWVQNQNFARKNSSWLPWLALPIGVEAGFSSAGAGALGTVLLLNYSEMTPPEVVGTDMLFGLVLAVIGSAFHWKFGSISGHVLTQLLDGGIPGVVIGCVFARRVPERKLKVVIAVIAIFAGLQLVWSGSRTLIAEARTLHTARCRGSRTQGELTPGVWQAPSVRAACRPSSLTPHRRDPGRRSSRGAPDSGARKATVGTTI